ncbi:MAG: transporter [Proteobacteria bacterium]|nr:MAG: transporter [Pseudomonadota bacterium]
MASSDREHPSEHQPHASGGVSTRLSAAEIHDNVSEPAREEMERSALALAASAFQSGLAIAFSFLAGAFAASLVAPLHAHAAAAAAYPLGFILVILARSELFTENTLRPVIPLLEERSARALWRTLRLWGLLLAGNLAGAALIGWVLARSAVVDAPVREQLDVIAATTTSGGFGLVFYRAIFAGWLIALLTWMLAATHATGAQIALIWLCTAPIAALHFRHSIAGAVEAFYRVAGGSAPLGEMLGGFVVPAVLGNTVGGVVLVALLSYAQVAADEPSRDERPIA